MPHARILRSAIRDLDDIWLYIARDNPDAADRTLAKLKDAADDLARMPGVGRQRDELASGVRSFPVKPYVIFYRKTRNGIDVLHVYHGARNFDALFGQ